MGEFSPFHWLIVLAIVVLLFGGKKIPEVMKGLGEGIRSFKEGMHGSEAGADADIAAASTPAPPKPQRRSLRKSAKVVLRGHFRNSGLVRKGGLRDRLFVCHVLTVFPAEFPQEFV